MDCTPIFLGTSYNNQIGSDAIWQTEILGS